MAMMSLTCRVCEAESPHDLYSFRERMYGLDGEFTYFLCRECGCLQISSVPSDMRRFYPPSYYSMSGGPGAGLGLKTRLKRVRDRAALGDSSALGRCLATIAPAPADLAAVGRLSLGLDAKVLDVGCGSGSLLHRMLLLGFTSLHGVDPFLRQDQVLPGLEIRRMSLDMVAGKFDLIMFHHSFEHLEDPRGTMALVKDRLEPGGRCLLRVPTVSSWAWEHYGRDWVQLDAPRHFFLHSTRSLEHLALAAGLTVEGRWYDSTAFQFWGSDQYVRGVALESSASLARSRVRRLLHLPSRVIENRRARVLNADGRGDSVAIVMCKPPAGALGLVPSRDVHGSAERHPKGADVRHGPVLHNAAVR
jgi:SAM-dependent methyltransferase